MTPYPEYKATNLPWLPQIAMHWVLVKIRELFTERNQKVSDKEYAPLSVSKGGVVPQISTVAKTDNGDNRKLVKVGDFVINSRSDRKGSSGISAYDGSVSLINLILKPRNDYNRGYLHYLLKNIPFIEEYYKNGRGIVADLWTTRYSEMKTISIPAPTAAEQEQIVRYLDSMTAKINKLIRAKKKQIALLQEQKQAIINQAVTKGLNPDAEMKDSGIDWLGQIPAHWDCLPVKFCSDILPGLAFDSQYFSSYGKYLLLRGINVGIGNINHEEVIFWNYDLDAMTQRFQLQENDIVLGLDRPWIKQGLRLAKISQNDLPALLVQRVCRIRPHKHCDNDFLINAVDVVLQKALQSQTTGISVPHISTNQVGNVKIPLPTYEEQLLIVNSIAEKTKTLKSYTDTLKQEILIILEYKNSLIASVVTGQVDVRNIQVEDFDPADLITETDDDPSEDDDQPLEESEE